MTKNIYKTLCLLGITLILSGFSKAQSPPNAFNYSAVARNSSGQPIATSKIGIQISILKTSTTGTVQYSENHTINTDAFGLFNLAIGAGTVQSGSMSAINWGTDNYFIKIGMDVTGGTNFLTMGTTQLMSVPYALHSKNASNGIDHISSDTDTLYLSNGKFFVAGSKVSASNSGGKTYIELFGDVTDAQADSIIKADLGPNTQFIYITNTTILTTVDLSAVKALMEFKITGNEVLANVNASPLQRCTQIFYIDSNPLLTTLLTDKLSYVGAVSIASNDKLSALNFPLLKKALDIEIENNKTISTFSAVLLSSANNLYISGNTKLTTLTASSLKSASGISISDNGLTDINLSALTILSEGLNISGNTSLSSLNSSSLKSVGLGHMDGFGNLSISISNNGLTNVSFPALTILSGGLNIEENAALTSFTASSLISIGNDNSSGFSIDIRDNGLTNISFPALTTLSGGLNIESNASLTSLTANSLNSVGNDGNMDFNRSINIVNNGLTSISFTALSTLSGGLNISRNPKLTTLIVSSLNTVGTNTSGLSNYMSINITDNGLTSLSFTALSTVSGGLNIEGNAALTALTANSLNSVGIGNWNYNSNSINIVNNGLTSLSFTALTTLIGGLNIEGNAALTALTANSLNTAQDIAIKNNGLTSLSFPAVTTLSGGLNIEGNAALTALNTNSLNTAQQITIRNNGLTSLSFPALTTCEYLNIEGNTALTSLSFPALTTSSGSLNIEDNAALITLNVNKLNTIGTINNSDPGFQYNTLNIHSNGLTSLSLPALTTMNGAIKITNNSSLKTLNISALSKMPILDASQNKLSDMIWASQLDNWSGIILQNNNLPSSEINEILALLVAAGSSAYIDNGNNRLFLQTQTPLAPPTGQGLTDKVTLQSWLSNLFIITDY
jgi:hypothetical protein